MADFVYVKVRESWKHSRIVADVAAGIGSCLGLELVDQTRLQYAALVHDVGKVAVPIGILAKGDRRCNLRVEEIE